MADKKVANETKFWLVSTIMLALACLILFALNISPRITGNVVSEKIGKTTGSVLGLIFIIGGILLFQVGRARGLEVKVYSTKKPLTERKSEEDTTKFWVTDPKMIFGGVGRPHRKHCSVNCRSNNSNK